MNFFKQFAYWFVGVNVVAAAAFSLVSLIYGGRDLISLLKYLKSERADEADDGRVIQEK